MASGKSIVLSLYKQLMRESGKISSYNFRNYALRRVRDAFKDNKSLSDMNAVNAKLEFARKNLDCIRRQVFIGHLYSAEKLVIEQEAKKL